MARSQDSYNKKEKEKQRHKKKQDKLKKKEERKANSDKGKSLDDMIAYVDEEGKLSDTPPDPKKKKKFKAEDIEIGVSRQADVDPEDLIRTGRVTFFNESRGYGFIKDNKSGESIFVHVNKLQEPVSEGDTVTFETEMGPKGPSATNVRLQKSS
jgi:cold shock CspA family protein